MEALRVALRPLVKKELSSDRPVTEEELKEIEGLFYNWLNEKVLNRPLEEQRIFSLYIGGFSAESVAERTSIPEQKVRSVIKAIGLNRQTVLNQLKLYQEEVLNPVVESVQEQLRPIVKRLKLASLEAIQNGEVTGKDAVRAFTETSKLLATLSGELVERKQIEVGANEAFKQIMGIASGFEAKVIEAEYELRE
jgi:hypothetical protein